MIENILSCMLHESHLTASAVIIVPHCISDVSLHDNMCYYYTSLYFMDEEKTVEAF